uniref:Secreted protein n=1 Tax=Ixodes ricinus TaxID=34613 RepID=A0A6B0UTS8_IXORI
MTGLLSSCPSLACFSLSSLLFACSLSLSACSAFLCSASHTSFTLFASARFFSSIACCLRPSAASSSLFLTTSSKAVVPPFIRFSICCNISCILLVSVVRTLCSMFAACSVLLPAQVLAFGKFLNRSSGGALYFFSHSLSPVR